MTILFQKQIYRINQNQINAVNKTLWINYLGLINAKMTLSNIKSLFVSIIYFPWLLVLNPILLINSRILIFLSSQSPSDS